MRVLFFALCLFVLVYSSFQSGVKECKNGAEMTEGCEFMKKRGHCHAKGSLVALLMKNYCAKTCGFC
ncbi:hypothetical protein GCK32_009471 [Trichostrongylus colubriformis]